MQGFFSSFGASPRQVATMRRWETKAERNPAAFHRAALSWGRCASAAQLESATLVSWMSLVSPAGRLFPIQSLACSEGAKTPKARRRQNCRTEAETAGGALQLSGEDFLGAWHQRARLAIFGAHFVALGFHTPWGSARSKFGGGSERCLGSLCLRLVELRLGSLPPAFQSPPSSSG